jgi:hypothetical protein
MILYLRLWEFIFPGLNGKGFVLGIHNKESTMDKELMMEILKFLVGMGILFLFPYVFFVFGL